MKLLDDCDAEYLIAQLISEGDFRAVANVLKWLAAVRAATMPVHAVNCGCPHCTRRRLDQHLRLKRQWEKALRAGVAA
ncbi:hypothetical protein [Streptomyces syringium]|uniref:hypothetical protein n=1 Tax=Streptomyces syringium TaxID=76729 RepID=UPI003AAB5B60